MCSESGKRKRIMTVEMADNVARCLLLAFEDDDPTLHRDSREALVSLGQTDRAIDDFIDSAFRFARNQRCSCRPTSLN